MVEIGEEVVLQFCQVVVVVGPLGLVVVVVPLLRMEVVVVVVLEPELVVVEVEEDVDVFEPELVEVVVITEVLLRLEVDVDEELTLVVEEVEELLRLEVEELVESELVEVVVRMGVVVVVVERVVLVVVPLEGRPRSWNGRARAEPARAAVSKANESCMFDGQMRTLKVKVLKAIDWGEYAAGTKEKRGNCL